ncbi:prepilin-type N-terminal cleavage/methylation domain-containing protein [Francisella sp. LA112445]|uniref:PilW family protein n=1 Tax=Francisella sp. LA112445 TaxID=1395624 RepID=UPI001788C71E|nr:prepilin-type N-terminal cleavage/methylation domain-containing protein [Francisella sp. LA112445]QIW10749.1 prepilin-type N-terminal cleavage/methylation domain-containing protein [Francisella sp. LA112445]
MIVRKSNKASGFTLPELMVSMVIAAIVMSMALGIYINMKQQYTKLNEKHRINTDQLMVKQIFYNAIGHAGYITKYGDLHQHLVDNSGDNLGDIFGKMGIITIGKAPIEEVSGLPEGLTLPFESCQQRKADQGDLKSMNLNKEIHCVEPDTDYLVIQRSSLDSSLKTNSSNNIFKVNDFQKNISPERNISIDDYLVLCNAFECDLVKAGAITGDFVSTTNRIENKFKVGDYVGKYVLEIFFVADTGKKDKDGKELYSLYEYIKQNSNDSSMYELISNVSDLKIQYVLNSDIHRGSAELNWQEIEKAPINVRSDTIAALRVSFKVSGQPTSKIFLVGDA